MPVQTPANEKYASDGAQFENTLSAKADRAGLLLVLCAIK